jgi:hypothetical protein
VTIDAREAASGSYRIWEVGVAERRTSQWLTQPWIGVVGVCYCADIVIATIVDSEVKERRTRLTDDANHAWHFRLKVGPP